MLFYVRWCASDGMRLNVLVDVEYLHGLSAHMRETL